MATTFTKIATVEVGSGGASSIDFTSIPATYTDLCLKVSTRDSGGGVYQNIIVKINGVTTSQSNRAILGLGSGTPSSFSDTPLYAVASASQGSTASTFSNVDIYIPNYASTSTNKSVSIDAVTENNSTVAGATLVAGLYASNTAVTSVILAPNSGTFSQYSTATLYGVSNA
jgi:hypothetical protein